MTPAETYWVVMNDTGRIVLGTVVLALYVTFKHMLGRVVR